MFPVVNSNEKYHCIECNYKTNCNRNWNKHIHTDKHTRNITQTNPNKYFCDKCNFNTTRQQHWEEHLLTMKHRRAVNEIETEPVIYECEKCNYSTTRKTNWDSHINTVKHNNTTTYDCNLCNLKFNNRSTLIRHQNTRQHLILTTYTEQHKPEAITPAITYDMMEQLVCKVADRIDKTNNDIMRQELVNHTNEMKQLLCQAIERSNTTTNVSYTQNNSFNINMFLNETCKNAKNMSEFIDSIVITHEDLINNGELGFVGGMIKILTDNLNKLDITERPLHCTDLKRETIYIKDDGIWSKENSEEKINRGIQRISNRNVQELLKWKRSNPDYADINSEFSDLCHKIHCTVMAGDERVVLFPRVAKGIAKFVLLDKQQFTN